MSKNKPKREAKKQPTANQSPLRGDLRLRKQSQILGRNKTRLTHMDVESTNLTIKDPIYRWTESHVHKLIDQHQRIVEWPRRYRSFLHKHADYLLNLIRTSGECAITGMTFTGSIGDGNTGIGIDFIRGKAKSLNNIRLVSAPLAIYRHINRYKPMICGIDYAALKEDVLFQAVIQNIRDALLKSDEIKYMPITVSFKDTFDYYSSSNLNIHVHTRVPFAPGYWDVRRYRLLKDDFNTNRTSFYSMHMRHDKRTGEPLIMYEDLVASDAKKKNGKVVSQPHLTRHAKSLYLGTPELDIPAFVVDNIIQNYKTVMKHKITADNLSRR